MKIIAKMSRRIEQFISQPGQELGRWARFVRFQIDLWRFCIRRLRQNNAMAMSSALSFRTIFAMIPAIVLAVLVLKSFGLLEHTKQGLRQVLAKSGISEIAFEGGREKNAPETAPSGSAKNPDKLSVAELIEEQVERIGGKFTFGSIGPVGAALLIWTALTLLTTMERSLNRIFQAPRSRSLGRRILLYWSVITLGPVLVAAGVYVGNGISEASKKNIPGLSWLMEATGWAGPILVGILVLAAVYTLMPNTAVRFRAALGGAVIAVPLWLLAKWGFTLYVAGVARSSLYGALGLLPLFLIWLNFSWLSFLFGAQLAHTAANVRQMALAELAEKISLGPSDLLAAAIAVTGPYQNGSGAVGLGEISRNLNLPLPSVQQLLDQLALANVVCAVERSDGPAYVLARPAEKIPVLEVLHVVGTEGAPVRPDTYTGEIAKRVEWIQRRARDQLGDLTLAEAVSARREE